MISGKPGKPPVYHHAVLRDFWTKFDLEVTRNAKEHWFSEKVKEMQIGFGTLVASLWIALAFVFLPLPRSNATNGLTFPILIFFVIGLLPLKAVEPHYFAPIAALAYVHTHEYGDLDLQMADRRVARGVRWQPCSLSSSSCCNLFS